MGAGEPSGVEPAQMGAPAHLALDQPGVLQRLDVLRGRSERDRKRFRELAHRPFAARELAQHPPPGRVAQGTKDGVQLRRL